MEAITITRGAGASPATTPEVGVRWSLTKALRYGVPAFNQG